MSKDFQLAWRCPHLTIEEHVTLGEDRTSLQISQPVGNSTTVRVLANDDVVIPQPGLYSAGQLHSTLSGPFDLVEGSDTLTITTPSGTDTVSFGVVGTQRFSAVQIVEKLRKVVTLVYVESLNSHLIFTDTSGVGPDSYVRVGGSAAASLGFGVSGTNSRQACDRGRQIYPSWTLEKRADDSTFLFPRFTAPIRNNPVFKVTYAVPERRCKRCRGTFIENDCRFDSSGQAIVIRNEDLLLQSSQKILLTDLGSNPYHPQYGTTIRSRIGSKSIGNVAARLSEDVRRALGRFQDIQQAQAEYQQVTAKERLYAILNVQARPHAQDPTTFWLDVVVQNASGEPVTLSIVFSVPEVVAVLGSNGLYLGTDATGLTLEQQRRLYPAGRTLIPLDGS